MRKIWHIPFLPALVMLSFTACQKEVSGDGVLPPEQENPLLGTWKLINGDISTKVTQHLSDDLGTITNIATLDYITTNNKGSITFEKDRILSKQISFDVADTIKSEIYVNGFFVESFDTPVTGSVPPSTASNNYMLIGTDSIYCPNGSFLEVEGADGTQTMPTGFKFIIQDNLLTLTNRMNESEETTEEGATTTTQTESTIITTFEKQ